VLTIERASLTEAHRRAAGLSESTPVVGLDEVGHHFVDVILGNGPELDADLAAEEHLAAARLLIERHPEVRVIVLECTNMPPYAAAIQAETGLPVHDITTLLGGMVGAQRRVGFTGWM
jgi:Asp/Glu/hydantoin racemase